MSKLENDCAFMVNKIDQMPSVIKVKIDRWNRIRVNFDRNKVFPEELNKINAFCHEIPHISEINMNEWGLVVEFEV